MPRKSDAREKMIRTAGELFRARGYHGVGLSEILAESGAPKGSFYYHFPNGKHELALAVIDSGGRFVSKLIDKAFEDVDSVKDGVGRLVDMIASAFEHSGFEQGCPVTSLVLDLAPADDEARLHVDNVFRHWMDRMLEHAARLGTPEDRLAVYRKAFRALLVAIEGGWVLSRSTHTIQPILLAKDIFNQMLEPEQGFA
ncbi:MAG: TetR/AcrR family transcriptional regulator, partial [Pseudomonadota bacterium]